MGWRTSVNSWCDNDCYTDPITQRVQARISALTGIPPSHAEYLQMLKYVVPQYYKVRGWDWTAPTNHCTKRHTPSLQSLSVRGFDCHCLMFHGRANDVFSGCQPPSYLYAMLGHYADMHYILPTHRFTTTLYRIPHPTSRDRV